MTCERCRLIEDEYVAVEAEGLTRDALMLAVATLRSDRLRLLAALEQTQRQMVSHVEHLMKTRRTLSRVLNGDGATLATGQNGGQK